MTRRLDLPPLEKFGESLRVAADREIRAARARDRRRRRRVGALALALIGVLAAGAEGLQLISTGSPAHDRTDNAREYRPSGKPELSAVARDPAGGLSWGVALYDAQDGTRCALTGRVRGKSLGEESGGVFHPFAPGTGGACGDLEQSVVISDLHQSDRPVERFVLYGRTREAAVAIQFRTGDAHTFRTEPGSGGGFLFVFDAKPEMRGSHLSALGRDGREIHP